MKKLLTVTEYARHIGVSRQSIYGRIQRGSIKYRIEDGIYLIPTKISGIKDKAKIQPNSVVEMTLSQICNLLGKNIKIVA